jgi:hypothetical protein
VVPVDCVVSAGVSVFQSSTYSEFILQEQEGRWWMFPGCVVCGGVRVENGVNRELGAQIPRPFV